MSTNKAEDLIAALEASGFGDIVQRAEIMALFETMQETIEKLLEPSEVDTSGLHAGMTDLLLSMPAKHIPTMKVLMVAIASLLTQQRAMVLVAREEFECPPEDLAAHVSERISAQVDAALAAMKAGETLAVLFPDEEIHA